MGPLLGFGTARRLRAWSVRLLGLVTRRRRSAQFDAELDSHVELHVEENLRRGMGADEARRQALAALGGLQSTKDAYRDRGGFPLLDEVGQDVRFALRMVRKAPGFTVAAALILALGIGANGAVFSLVNGTLIRPLNGGRLEAKLVGVFSGERSRPDRFRLFSYPEFVDLRDRNDVFAGLLAESSAGAGMTEGSTTRRIEATLVSANYFSALGVDLAAGRAFTAAEEHPRSSAAVVVVSHAYWRRHGLRADVVGSRLTINGREFTIAGVAPEWFHGTIPIMSTDVWLPFGALPLLVGGAESGLPGGSGDDRAMYMLTLWATLKPGVTMEDAQARLAPLADALAAAYPATNKDQRLVVQTQSRTNRGPAPISDAGRIAGVAILMAISGLVLFVACLNLANMLLARGTARHQEIAVRLALGGSRLRIVRQLVVEGLVLAVLGASAALFFSWWAAEALVATAREMEPAATLNLDVSPDARVVALVAAAAVLSAIVFGLGPAWRLSRPELATAMKSSAPLTSSRGRRFTLPGLMVGTQIALSLALLVAAGVFLRAGIRAASIDPGFALDGGLIAEIDAGLAGYDRAQAGGALASVLSRIRDLPGVDEASLASIVPFGNSSERRFFQRDGEQGEGSGTLATFTVVSTRYFASVGLPILEGRDFTDAEERMAKAPMAIVDRAFAERMFGTTSPIGRLVRATNWDGSAGESLQIVGVVPTVRDRVLEAPTRPHLYVPVGREPRAAMTLHVKVAAGTEAGMVARVRQTIHAVDERLPIIAVRTLTEHRDSSGSLWAVDTGARLLAAFGAIALVLAAVGVYGLRAYLVARRTREIGIRMALGSTRGGVLGELVREGTRIVAGGLFAGLALAVGLVQVLRQSEMLVEVSPLDPLTFTLAPLILAAVTTLASYIPARRALRIDPAVALRPE